MVLKVHKQNSRYLLWPLAVLLFLTVGVFFTSREIPNQQDVRSRAQIDENAPAGPIVSLSFSVPGISSQGGNLTPVHPTRNVKLRIYDRDSNTFDKTTKPLYEIATQATFDTDTASPTYTSFVNFNVALGTVVPEGDYQIAFKTDQAPQTLIKEKTADLGGKLFTIHTDGVVTLPLQTVTLGDIVPLPDGDNRIDNADYTAFIACFGAKFTADSCAVKQLADLDDNGVVDGVDYNLLAVSLKSSATSGGVTPTPSPVAKVLSPTATPAPVATPAAVNGNILTVIILILVFGVLLGGAVVFLSKAKNKTLESKEYFIKKQSDPSMSSGQDSGVWLTLTDDNGPKLGHYKEKDVKEGFAHIKGTTKKANGKTFIEISEIIWEEKD